MAISLNLFEVVVFEEKLKEAFLNKKYCVKAELKKVEDRYYFYIKVNEYNKEIEEDIIKTFEKKFKVSISWWDSYRSIKQAKKEIKRSQSISFMVEHPKLKYGLRYGVYILG